MHRKRICSTQAAVRLCNQKITASGSVTTDSLLSQHTCVCPMTDHGPQLPGLCHTHVCETTCTQITPAPSSCRYSLPAAVRIRLAPYGGHGPDTVLLQPLGQGLASSNSGPRKIPGLGAQVVDFWTTWVVVKIRVPFWVPMIIRTIILTTTHMFTGRIAARGSSRKELLPGVE